MAGGFLRGTVTFQTNAHRNRASTAIGQWVAAWNAAHPTTPFTGSTANTTFTYPAGWDSPYAGTSQRALSLDYTCVDYAGIEEAQRAIVQDVNANSFLDIVSLGTGLIL